MRFDRSKLPTRTNFHRYELIRLDTAGRLLDESGTQVRPANVKGFLADLISPARTATDIVVFVHGWRTSAEDARAAFARFFGAVHRLGARWSDRYPAMGEFHPYFVGIHWPSTSRPTIAGYRKIRDRAHLMTRNGYAAHVLAEILGYLDSERVRPLYGAQRLRTSRGQYLHCVGHSFGGRFLAEAIRSAAAPPQPETLGWPWGNEHPFAVDTLLVYQMAADPFFFDRQLAGLVGHGPLHGPVILTHSRYDYANAIWHAAMEGLPGIGAVGAMPAAGTLGAPPSGGRVTRRPRVTTIPLRRPEAAYSRSDFTSPIVNVDSSAIFRDGRSTIVGAHSDYWRPESIHLLLSLISLAR